MMITMRRRRTMLATTWLNKQELLVCLLACVLVCVCCFVFCCCYYWFWFLVCLFVFGCCADDNINAITAPSLLYLFDLVFPSPLSLLLPSYLGVCVCVCVCSYFGLVSHSLFFFPLSLHLIHVTVSRTS